jgi:hypothetical protein
MTAIYKDRTARKPHRCSWCEGTIQPGERYVLSSLTPHDNDIGNLGWWHSALHGRERSDCPEDQP